MDLEVHDQVRHGMPSFSTRTKYYRADAARDGPKGPSPRRAPEPSSVATPESRFRAAHMCPDCHARRTPRVRVSSRRTADADHDVGCRQRGAVVRLALIVHEAAVSIREEPSHQACTHLRAPRPRQLPESSATPSASHPSDVCVEHVRVVVEEVEAETRDARIVRGAVDPGDASRGSSSLPPAGWHSRRLHGGCRRRGIARRP